MRLSVESVFFVNFLLDALTIVATVRHRIRLRPARVFGAAAFGGLAAAYLTIIRAGDVWRVLFALLAAPVMIRIAAGRTSTRTLLGLCAAFIAVSAFMAGIMGILSGISFWASLIVCVVSAVVADAVLGLRRRALDTWEAWVELRYRGKSTRFRAIVDTGNHLTEPVSGLPVMIVSCDTIWEILPDAFSPRDAVQTLPPSFRLVGYGGVGGTGELGCFMPDELKADTGRGDKPMGDIWIAVYPGALPGNAVALAPPSFLNS